MVSLREKAEQLLVAYGDRIEAPPYALKIGAVERSFFQKLTRQKAMVVHLSGTSSEGVTIYVFSSSPDPRKAKWIVIVPERHIDKFVLTSGDAWVLEDMGLNDRVDKPRADNFSQADAKTIETITRVVDAFFSAKSK